MKKYDLVNLMNYDVMYVSESDIRRYLSIYKKNADELLKRSNVDCVVYAIRHNHGRRPASYHVIEPILCSEKDFRKRFPKSDRSMTPYLVSRK